MPRAIESNGYKHATVRFGFFGTDDAGQPKIGTPKQLIPDGDTINTTLLAGDNLPIRFLGIDTPEKTLPLPGVTPLSFRPLTNDAWKTFLDNPFQGGSPLCQSLTAHITARIVGGGAAENHHEHGARAEDELEDMIVADINEYIQAGMLQNSTEFTFYLRFAFEIVDGFGRLLCFPNRNQPERDVPSARPLDYSTRMLGAGRAAPYFIWPNINPFRAQGSILNAVFAPGSASALAQSDSKLRGAREMVRASRLAGDGIYDPNNPLRLAAFEVRFLGRQAPPKRWLIDLSKEDDILVHPQNYYTIPNAEDRLFVNPEHVPLFTQAGWVRQQAPN